MSDDFSNAPAGGGEPRTVEGSRVLFRKGGGGYEPPKVLDTQTLSPEDRAQVARLLGESGLQSIPSKHDSRTRDDFEYELTITEPEGSWAICIDRKSLPASARPLIEFLDKKAAYETLQRTDQARARKKS